MQVFLNLLDGSQRIIEITQQTTLHSILLQQNLNEVQLISQGIILSDDSLTNLVAHSNVYVTAALDGGKKKKKKKVYTTKKKNKHIHKKIKLLPLTLYAVAGDGKVSQNRKACPNCGPGTFMGQHWDRYYCGFCHTTIKMDAETIKKNQQILKKKRAALQAQRKAKEKEAAQKAPAGKAKKDAKKGKKK